MEMRPERLARYKEQSKIYLDELTAQVEQAMGAITPAAKTQLQALYDLELLRLEAAECLAEKGLRERYSNGRQSLERENKTLGQMLKIVAAQTRLLQALKLLPSGKRAAEADEDDDGDGLDDC